MPRRALTWNAAAVVAICLFAWLALPPADGAAQSSSPSPSPERLWKAYPLAPTAEPGAQAKQSPTPAASVRANRRAARAASGGGGVPVFVLVLLVLIAAGGTLTFVGIRRRRGQGPAAPTAPLPSRPAVPTVGHPPSGRFSRPVTKTTATAAAPRRDRNSARVAADAPRRVGPAAPAAPEPSPMTAVTAPTAAGLPPDPRVAWAAEIEWRQIDDESHFCVMAKGAGTVEVARSPALDWPPDGPAAVQAVTDAAGRLAAMLVAAGWKPLPSGSSWYAKRFAWEPAVGKPANGGKATPSRSTGAKPAEAARAATRVPTQREGAGPTQVVSSRSRVKLALLGLLAVIGLIVARQLGDGIGDGGSPSDGSIDLSVPLLALAGVLLVVLMVSQIRRALR